MQFKKWLCAILIPVLLMALLPNTVMAAPVERGVITGRQEGQMHMQLAAVDSTAAGPALAPGQHERWIDRLDQPPAYATSFYSWLEENVQSGGALIDPTQATAVEGDSGQVDTYVYGFYTIEGSADFTYTGTDHDAAAQKALLEDLGDAHMLAVEYATAVYGAFDRDHPEVFWLNSRTLYGYSVPYSYTRAPLSKTGTVTYSVELYFYLKSPDYDIRNENYQSVEAITAAREEQDAAVEEILSQCPRDSAYEQVRYLNRVLTESNCYNSLVAAGTVDGVTKDAWKGISALTGNVGTEGPVCEGYARAMMVLCKELGIPCVLTEGSAKASENGTPIGHMWNDIKLEDSWYAVDLTWNDPYASGKETEACSGYETEEWFLLGSETVKRGMTFATSHVVTNYTTVGSLSYTNCPALAAEAYVPPAPEPEPEIVVPEVTLKAPALEFKDTICVVAFYTVDNTEDVVEMGMITYKNQVEAWSVETADHVIPGAGYDEVTDRYYSASQGIYAKYLVDTVYLACYAKLTDGSYVYTKLAPYSPITYATNQLKNSTDVQLKQLVASMLNYSTEAQLYFGYHVDTPANAALTEEQRLLPEAFREDMVQTVPAVAAEKQGMFANNQGFSIRKPAISFEGAFCINYFFTPAYAPVDGITLYYWNEGDFNAVDVLTIENASGSIAMEGTDMEQYRGDIEGIAAKNLSQAVYVAAIYSDGTTTRSSGVLGYSIGAYCSGQAAKGGDIAALAEATAVYGYHAKQYFG